MRPTDGEAMLGSLHRLLETDSVYPRSSNRQLPVIRFQRYAVASPFADSPVLASRVDCDGIFPGWVGSLSPSIGCGEAYIGQETD